MSEVQTYDKTDKDVFSMEITRRTCNTFEKIFLSKRFKLTFSPKRLAKVNV